LFFALVVFQNGGGQDGQCLLVTEVADKDRPMFHIRRLEQGAVQVGYLFKFLFDRFVAFLVFARQHCKKQIVEVVIGSDLVFVEEGIGLVAFVISDELRFEQF